MNKIDISKKYRTRDGAEVIIHTVNGINPAAPVVGEIEDFPYPCRWDQFGKLYDGPGGEESDLIEVREPRECYILEIDGVLSNWSHATKYSAEDASRIIGKIVKFREVIE